MNRPLEHLRHLGYACIAFMLLGAGIYFSLATGLTPAALLDQPAPGMVVILGRMIGMVFIFFGLLPILLGVLGSALGLGWFIHDRLRPQGQGAVLVSLAIGLTIQWWIVWLLGHLGLFNFWTAWVLCAAGISMLAWRLAGPAYRWLREVDRWPNPPWTLLPLLPALGIMLVTLCCPPGTLWTVEALGYDVTSYHLQLPREWMQIGRIAGLEHNVYSFLPGLIETGYFQLGVMHGSVYDAIYTTQALHAIGAIMTAWAIGLIVHRLTSATLGLLAGGLFLLIPWTLITASQAYNEMGAMALSSVALLVALDSRSLNRRSACIVGLLLGGAVLCKLTIGAMLAPPILLALGWNLTPWPINSPAHRERSWSILRPALAILVMMLCLSPWLVRNTLATGNPVFPLATNLLGRGHWDEQASKRWAAIHGPSGTLADRLALLNSRWLTNAGYGAVGGTKPVSSASTSQPTWDIVRFPRTGGLPVLWLLSALGLILGILHPAHRRIALFLTFMLGWSVLIWLTATHLQSRFLIPTLLPGCILATLAMAPLDRPHGSPRRWLFPLIVSAVASVLILHQLEILRSQTPAGVPLWSIADSLPRRNEPPGQIGQSIAGDHPLNHLTTPANRTLILADNSRLLYIRRAFVYQSAFDINLLDRLIRQAGSTFQPQAITHALKSLGITHVWINQAELHRLQVTYDFAPDLTANRLTALTDSWRPVWEAQPLTLYELP